MVSLYFQHSSGDDCDILYGVALQLIFGAAKGDAIRAVYFFKHSSGDHHDFLYAVALQLIFDTAEGDAIKIVSFSFQHSSGDDRDFLYGVALQLIVDTANGRAVKNISMGNMKEILSGGAPNPSLIIRTDPSAIQSGLFELSLGKLFVYCVYSCCLVLFVVVVTLIHKTTICFYFLRSFH